VEASAKGVRSRCRRFAEQRPSLPGQLLSLLDANQLDASLLGANQLDSTILEANQLDPNIVEANQLDPMN